MKLQPNTIHISDTLTAFFTFTATIRHILPYFPLEYYWYLLQKKQETTVFLQQ